MFKYLNLIFVTVVGTMLGAPHAMAQEFPKKQPIKIVVAAAPGGTTDVLARITAEFLQRRLGQAVIVENRTGAAGAVAGDYVAKAQPDGYTLHLAGAGLSVLPAIRNNLPYKTEDFTYLVRFFTAVPLLVVGPKSTFSTSQEIIAYMKSNPGKMRHGTPGVGSLNHMGSALFESSTGVKTVHIPYSGISQVYNDLLAGNLDFAIGAVPPFPDTLKVLGPAGSKRHSLYPNLPTFEEMGYKNASHDVWWGYLSPPNMPKSIADRLTLELSAVFKDPEAIAKFRAATKDVPDEKLVVGEDFRKQVLQELKNWKTVADQEKIVVQQ
ncbi:MAG: transporter substrate-binding protein [Polaromonas sp.]|nr:transporter substrate-binding protein [Polaromonas sp.]